jgi:hypothetical protein
MYGGDIAEREEPTMQRTIRVNQRGVEKIEAHDEGRVFLTLPRTHVEPGDKVVIVTTFDGSSWLGEVEDVEDSEVMIQLS